MTYLDLQIPVYEYPRIQVIGNSEASFTLFQRLNELVNDHQKVVLSRVPLSEPFDLVLDVDGREPLHLGDYGYRNYKQVSWQFCMGLTPARKALRDSDWQAQRDIERLFLQWHDDGRNTLPTATLNLFRHREIMRAETDVEPNRVV